MPPALASSVVFFFTKNISVVISFWSKDLRNADIERRFPLTQGTFFLAPRISVVLTNPPENVLAKREQEERAVQAAWIAAVAKRPKLTNGQLIAFGSMEEKGGSLHIAAYRGEYRNFIAQRDNPNIDVGLEPLAVAGLVVAKDDTGQTHVVFGRRGKEVTQYPGFFELVPSGGMRDGFIQSDGSVGYLDAIETQLHEEAGIGAEDIAEARPFGLDYQPADRVWDICCLLRLKLSVAEFERKARSVYAEYDERFMLVPIGEVPIFVENNKTNLVPTSVNMAVHAIETGLIV